jgi:hypothetical protein
VEIDYHHNHMRLHTLDAQRLASERSHVRLKKKEDQMHLRALHIKNFRALEDVQIDFDNRVNIIVGPNAIGKTTILEAVRVAKALLAPRTQNEAQQVLISIGASSFYPRSWTFSVVSATVRTSAFSLNF